MGLSLCTFTPLLLLERTLIKVREDQAEEVIVIAASSLTRSWYHLLLPMACEIPFLLPGRRHLLSQCLPNKSMLFHVNLKTLRLTAWKLSCVPSRVMAFQGQLSKQSSLPLETQLEQCTKAGGRVLLASVASMKHVLDLLQAESDTLALNTIKGYVTA